MTVKAVLFDLDGTLLPMDQEDFVKAYFGLLARHLAPYGYESDTLIKAIWAGTKDMMKNTGEATNEELFWKRLSAILGDRCLDDMKHFDEFYLDGFLKVRDVCGYNPKAAQSVRKIKSEGFRVALATQPIFPSIATKTRLSWTGLDVSEFELFTAFENSRHSKPNPDYYLDVAGVMNLDPCDCLMVGNDVSDDMPAEATGMKVFLLTDCLINHSGEDISRYPNGNFDDLIKFLKISDS